MDIIMDSLIHKGQLFHIKGQRMLLTSGEINMNDEKKQCSNALIVLNYWEQCDYEDISVIPVAIVKYRSVEEKYEIFRSNIVLGDVEDICLI